MFKLNDDYQKQVSINQTTRLNQAHNDAITKLNAKMDVYASIVSGIKSFVEHSDKFPDETQMQSFLKNLITQIKFQDSLIVSFVDKSQIFQYVVTPNLLDPANLKGLDVHTMRPSNEIAMLDSLVNYSTQITLFPPINLKEGYPAFPFNFTAIDSKDSVHGYFAPLISTNYLLNDILQPDYNYDFYHRFSINDNEFTRNYVYDQLSDLEKGPDKDKNNNFFQSDFEIRSSSIDFCGLLLKIETRFKTLPQQSSFYSYLIYLTTIIIVLFLAFTLLQLRASRNYVANLKRANTEIQIKSNQNEADLKHIQSLLREIHHRVKNNLQIISSLLNLQTMDESNERVVSALQMCRTRVQSMALVHQKLYHQEGVFEVNVKEYVDNLFDNVYSSMGQYNVNVNFTNHTDIQLKFNVDTVIPFGLILNELLTNSFKYAFDESNSPEITIKIKANSDKSIQVIYTDNGSGFNEDKIEENSFGIELIKILTEQLNGKLSFNGQNGAYFSFTLLPIK